MNGQYVFCRAKKKVVVVVAMLWGGVGVWGETITVNNTSDDVSVSHSLRWAINEINTRAPASGSSWEVDFSLPSNSNILSKSTLAINALGAAPVTINGTSGVTITSSGANVGNYVGLSAGSAGVTLNGLNVTGFSAGVVLNGAGGTVQNSTLTDNTGVGVQVIGNAAVVEGNTVSNPNWSSLGITVSGSNAKIQSNNVSETGGSAILLEGAGGTTLVAENTIQSVTGDGITIKNSSGVKVQHNTVGGSTANDLTVAGTSQNNLIIGNTFGGTLGGDGNGVSLLELSALNAVRGNSISGHFGLGVDVGHTPSNEPDGVTLNTGSDHEYFPVLHAVTTSSGDYLIQGWVFGPGGSYDLDFFASTAHNSSGYGEGQTYIGTLGAMIDSTYINPFVRGGSVGAGDFSVVIPGSWVPAGQTWFTATATSNGGLGRTSEFSAALQLGDTTGGGVDPFIGSVPLPSAVWMGAAMLGMVAGKRVLRRRKA
jgi:parallel beta-helix repeat protein